jgi:hypothetical protein
MARRSAMMPTRNQGAGAGADSGGAGPGGHKAESLRKAALRGGADPHPSGGGTAAGLPLHYPRGATEFEAQYDLDGRPSDQARPGPSALDNAKEYFEKYDKAKRALEGVPALLEAAENELAFLKQLETDLALAANWPRSTRCATPWSAMDTGAARANSPADWQSPP